MVADFGMDIVIFQCRHAHCGEVFEKSLDHLADLDEIFCPRCGTLASVGRETPLLAGAGGSGSGKCQGDRP
jgi:hypothetical protein